MLMQPALQFRKGRRFRGYLTCTNSQENCLREHFPHVRRGGISEGEAGSGSTCTTPECCGRSDATVRNVGVEWCYGMHKT